MSRWAIALCVAVVCTALAGVDAANTILTLTLFNATYHPPNAPSQSLPVLCNDGSRPGFWYALNSSSTDWVIHMQGGYWCSDVASCQWRQKNSPALTGSGTWTSTMGLGGVFSNDPAV